MAKKHRRKYRKKVKCSICKKVFNSDYKDKHSEKKALNIQKKKHTGEKVKYPLFFISIKLIGILKLRLKTEAYTKHIFQPQNFFNRFHFFPNQV